MIGVLGGTFDPVHHGHLRVAVEIREMLGLQEMRLLPCRLPPHRASPQASAEFRLEMLKRATQMEGALNIDVRELQRDGPSYMVDTLESIRREIGTLALILVLGADAFLNITSWHRWQELFQYAHIVVLMRPGFLPKIPVELERGAVFQQIESPQAMRNVSCGLLYFHSVIQLDISSSMIRELIRQGGNARYLLPNDVLEFIKKENLYR